MGPWSAPTPCVLESLNCTQACKAKAASLEAGRSGPAVSSQPATPGPCAPSPHARAGGPCSPTHANSDRTTGIGSTGPLLEISTRLYTEAAPLEALPAKRKRESEPEGGHKRLKHLRWPNMRRDKRRGAHCAHCHGGRQMHWRLRVSCTCTGRMLRGAGAPASRSATPGALPTQLMACGVKCTLSKRVEAVTKPESSDLACTKSRTTASLPQTSAKMSAVAPGKARKSEVMM